MHTCTHVKIRRQLWGVSSHLYFRDWNQGVRYSKFFYLLNHTMDCGPYLCFYLVLYILLLINKFTFLCSLINSVLLLFGFFCVCIYFYVEVHIHCAQYCDYFCYVAVEIDLYLYFPLWGTTDVWGLSCDVCSKWLHVLYSIANILCKTF